jgi:pimeloyl-ACP methyl ester carboxylesterase
MNNPDKRKSFTEFLNSIALLSQRRAGSLNDGKQFLNFTGRLFKNITSPTLILYGTKDNFVPVAEQVYLSTTLPNSKYIEIEGGTHFMLISHDDVLVPLIADFLKTHAPLK